MRTRVVVLALIGTALAPCRSALAVPPLCHVVVDPAGDGGTPLAAGVRSVNDPALDVLSADIGIGNKSLVLVVRVASLGSTAAQGGQTKRWDMNFAMRGQTFATSATRAPDGSDFRVLGDFPEQNTAAPGATTGLPVAGSFDEQLNEIRVVVPRRLLPILRPKDSVTNLAVDSYVGAGVTTERASIGYTADQTIQPGPGVRATAKTCVRAE